ncbi:MAG TPA: HAMP domain-containing sensor histidine kinase [Chloroflexota bacterium]|nr:HAMP domain-containing sensor histidine kinase [Chloroflexota bacterium]
MAAGRGPGVVVDQSATAADSANVAQLRLELDQLRAQLDERGRLNAILGEAAEQFVGAIVHDVKNPLAAIKISVQGLKRGLDRGLDLGPDQLTERLTRIEDAVNQALQQLALARERVISATAPRKPLKREAVDLVGLVRDLAKRLRREAGQHRLRLNCQSAALVGVWDEAHLRQALEALVDNALKFSSPGGRTTITVRRDGDAAEIRVSDSGIGIPERDLPHVCERFYRAENVLGRYKGAGIGLAQAMAAISGHDGQLSITSREHRGSTFTVRLPLRD